MHLTYILESIIAILLVHYRYFVLSGLTISRCRQTSELPYRDIGILWKVEVDIIAILFYHIAISSFYEKWRLTLSLFCFVRLDGIAMSSNFGFTISRYCHTVNPYRNIGIWDERRYRDIALVIITTNSHRNVLISGIDYSCSCLPLLKSSWISVISDDKIAMLHPDDSQHRYFVNHIWYCKLGTTISLFRWQYHPNFAIRDIVNDITCIFN